MREAMQSKRFGVHSFRRVSLDRDKSEGGKEPPKQGHHDTTCPYCKQAIPHHADTFSMFGGGIRQLFGALCTILVGALRFARFAVAGALSIVGFIGACCQSLAVRIAHKNDRRHLDRF